jgi:hypothetical protein
VNSGKGRAKHIGIDTSECMTQTKWFESQEKQVTETEE